jgi:hypothetical protein
VRPWFSLARLRAFAAPGVDVSREIFLRFVFVLLR